MMKPVLMALLFVLASLAGCIGGETEETSSVEAIFAFSPKNDIRVDQIVEFDASASLPQDTSLTYKWDFDNDGSIDETGRTTTWSFSNPGTFEVVLSVSDGITTAYQTREITIADADAEEPIANAGSYSPFSDCDGDSVSSGNFYLYYICEMDKSLSSKSMTSTTNVNLDGSNSESGDSNDYIKEWNWDLNLEKDSDGDGDYKNDADMTGETVEWRDLVPGEYKIALTVINGQGLTETDETVVYVNYVAKWNDFSIGGNNSNSAIEIEFDYPVVNDEDSGNTIRRTTGELVYPKEDSDCTNVPGTNNCRAELNIYAYNEKDDHVQNTSSIGIDQRSAGDDCDSDTDCVWLQFTGSYHYSEPDDDGDYPGWDDGEWKYVIQNDKFNDLDIESFTIRLIYK